MSGATTFGTPGTPTRAHTLHSYRATTWPPHIEASDVSEHADMGALPTWRIRAPSAEFAAASARWISGHPRVLRVERIEQCGQREVVA